jgi:hypothetical protein
MRAGGTPGFCFVASAIPSGFAVPPRNKTENEVCDLNEPMAVFEASFGR